MKAKTLYTIIGLLVIGIVLVYVFNRTDSNTESVNFSFPAFNTDNIDTIHVKTASNEFDLKKTSAGWEVNFKVADTLKVSSFLESFDNLKITGPTSTSQDNYSRFNVDESGGTEVTLKNGTSDVLIVTVGKAGTSFGTTYIKPDTSDDVYLAHADWSSMAFKTADEWRDLLLWSSSENEVAKIVIEADGKTYEAVGDTVRWTAYIGDDIDNSKDAPYLTTAVLSMSATGFDEGEREFIDTITLYNAEGVEMAMYRVAHDDSWYYLRKSEGGEVFKVSPDVFENIWIPALFTE